MKTEALDFSGLVELESIKERTSEVRLSHVFWPLFRCVQIVFYVVLYAAIFTVRGLTCVLSGRSSSLRTVLGTVLADLFEALGPTFIKVGQILSSRPDLLPPEVVRPLLRLQDDVAPFDVKLIPRLIESAFSRPMEEIFASFDLRPVACASIAHVHRARLRDGRKVAVKIRRPGIVSKIDNDFRILYFWARRLSALPFMRAVPLISLSAEIGEAVKLQTSFEQEAENNRRFQEHFSGIEHIRFPRLVDELCVDSVLTMEFLDGLEKVSKSKLSASERRISALAGLRALYKMIFTDGFVHADLHPGNVFLREWGEVVVLDTGLVARLTDDDLQDFVDFFFGLINNDGKVCAQIICGKAAYFTKRYDKDRFESAIVELVAEYSALKSRDFEITSFVYQLIRTQKKFGICGSTKFIMTILSMVVFDGICKELYPDCDFQGEAQGFLITARYRRRSVRRADQLNASNIGARRYGPSEGGSEAGRLTV